MTDERMTHEVVLMLTCNHFRTERIEAAIYAPQVGEARTCDQCHQSVAVAKVSPPAWITDEYRPIQKRAP